MITWRRQKKIRLIALCVQSNSEKWIEYFPLVNINKYSLVKLLQMLIIFISINSKLSHYDWEKKIIVTMNFVYRWGYCFDWKMCHVFHRIKGKYRLFFLVEIAFSIFIIISLKKWSCISRNNVELKNKIENWNASSELSDFIKNVVVQIAQPFLLSTLCFKNHFIVLFSNCFFSKNMMKRQ